MDSERVEEYLEAIYKRQKTEMPVSTSSLAKDLNVSLPAVTDMLHRLQSEGFVEYTANKGSSLTELGNQKAITVVRRHRLWERFLTDILGVRWDKVHQEACRLEHATSPETEEKLASLLGNTDTCPHGHPIPDKKGRTRAQGGVPLSEYEEGQIVSIEVVAEEIPRLLREIERLGLKPKTVVTVKKKNSDGSVELQVGEKQQHIKKEIAEVLLAESVSGKAKSARDKEIPLIKLLNGEMAIIKQYVGGRSMLGRCLSMGFTPGSLVKMIKNFGTGPVLVKVHDTEVALGRRLADKIMVAKKKDT